MIPYVSRVNFSIAGCSYATLAFPCFRLMKSGISSMGPGRYSETMAMRSSSRSGLRLRMASRMPDDSNWNTPNVLASPSMA
jgi:hypothetical protein